MGGEVLLVQVHDEELAELHVLVPLQGQALAGPTQPLQVDAETLRELGGKEGNGAVGGRTRHSHVPMQLKHKPKVFPNGNPWLALTTFLGPHRTSVNFSVA